jgi:hypothetical protein
MILSTPAVDLHAAAVLFTSVSDDGGICGDAVGIALYLQSSPALPR